MKSKSRYYSPHQVYLKEMKNSIDAKKLVNQFNARMVSHMLVDVQEVFVLEFKNRSKWNSLIECAGIPSSNFWLIEKYLNGGIS
jgi:hypothetical protein